MHVEIHFFAGYSHNYLFPFIIKMRKLSNTFYWIVRVFTFSFQAWCTYIFESENKAKLITEFSNLLNSTTLKRLDQLIDDKRNLLKKYKSEKFRTESTYKQESDEIDRLRKTYQENAKDSETAKRKYAEVLSKDKFNNKDWERSKDRYVRSTLKLHQNHNDYVLALKSGNCHQGFYNDILVPTMLNSLQCLQEEYIFQW